MSSQPPSESRSHILSFEEHLELLSDDVRRLVTVTDGALANQVPTCPGWTVLDLLDHLWHVYMFWSDQVEAGDRTSALEPGERSWPAGADPVEAVEETAANLIARIEAAGPDLACWNWSGQDLHTAWLARRMALETAVHRFDAEAATDTITPIESGLAADGIGERLYVHLAADLPEAPEATLGGSLCLACSDEDVAFVVEVGAGVLHVREGSGPASACVRGSASDLLLFSWNRVGVDAVELTGERAVAEAWATLPV